MDYNQLLEQYGGISLEKQYSLFEIISESNWNIDINKGIISFSNGVEFPIQILGTFSHSGETWLWTWENKASNIPEPLLADAEALRQIGLDHNIEAFCTPKYESDATQVHAIGLIASGILNSSAYYMADYGEGILLVTIKSDLIDKAKYNEQARILSVFPNLISIFPINHKNALTNYLNKKGYEVNDNEDKLSAKKDSNTIYADFDKQSRLINLNGELK